MKYASTERILNVGRFTDKYSNINDFTNVGIDDARWAPTHSLWACPLLFCVICLVMLGFAYLFECNSSMGNA